MTRGEAAPRTITSATDVGTDVEPLREAAERALLAHGPHAAWAVRLIELADQLESSVDLAQRSRYADEIRRVYAGRRIA